jgi:Rha family phage regulatory protein
MCAPYTRKVLHFRFDRALDFVMLGDNNKPVTNSLKLAVVFGKQHKNVLRAINKMRGSEVPEIRDHARLNFELCFEVSEYRTVSGSRYSR